MKREKGNCEKAVDTWDDKICRLAILYLARSLDDGDMPDLLDFIAIFCPVTK